MRPAGPRGVAGTWTSPSHADATTAAAVFVTRSTRTSIMGRRDDPRRALSRGGANHRHHASGLSFGPAGRSDASERAEHATLKAMRAAARRQRARSPRTSTPLVVDHVSANAPGRTEGSREHTDLTVTCGRDDHRGRLRHTLDAHLDHGQTRGPPRPSSPPRGPRRRDDRRAPNAAAAVATVASSTVVCSRLDARLCAASGRTAWRGPTLEPCGSRPERSGRRGTVASSFGPALVSGRGSDVGLAS
jgi:hypothetical protein